MKRLFGLVLAGWLVLGVLSAPAGADSTVKVWTQNLYIGADLTPVIEAQEADEFYAAAQKVLGDIAANLFPLRAQRLATEIALYEPDLISLQEVEAISLNNGYPGPPFVDYLQSLLDALALRGQNYTVAATVVNLDLTVPIDLTGDRVPEIVRVVDRDVILVKEGVGFSLMAGDYTTGGLCGVPIQNPAPIGPPLLQSTPSAEGCNYTILAEVTSPVGSILIKRGFVGIDATVRGKKVFFVNTHLEQRILSTDFPLSALIQPAQAAELVGVLGSLAGLNPGVPIILAGDFNSSPKDSPVDVPPLPERIDPPYQIISGSGFTDSWTKNPLALLDPKGYTCCQNEFLDNKRSELYERIDLVFVRGSRFQPWAFVTTRVPLIFPAPRWASDHGGVFAKLVFK